jgi:hypothetical protein
VNNDIDDEVDGGLVLTFPDGSVIPAAELGVSEYAAGQSGQVTIPEVEDVAEEERKREKFIREQPLIKSIERGDATQDIISAILKEIAEELAHLKWERKKASENGKSTANYNTTRAAGLQQLANTLFRKLENTRAEQLDLKSPRFQKVLKLWLDFMYESMQKAGLGEQEIDLVMNTMKADLVDWETRILNE